MKPLFFLLFFIVCHILPAQNFFSLKGNEKVMYKNCGNILQINQSAVNFPAHWQNPDSFYFKTLPLAPQKNSNFKQQKCMLFPRYDSQKVWLCVEKAGKTAILDSAEYQVVEPPLPQGGLLTKNQQALFAPQFLTTKQDDLFQFKILPDAHFQNLCPTEAHYKLMLMSMYLHKEGKTTLVYNGDLSQHNPTTKGIDFNFGGDIYQHKGAYISVVFSKLYRMSFAKEYFLIASEAYASYTFLIE
ncbi:MAG: hypothetical protein ACKVTZ_04510 [Bacteroidia bacterium]